MRGITTIVVMGGLFVIAMLVGVPLMDKLAPMASGMAPGYASQIDGIHVTLVKWIVPVFLFTIILWGVFWILRQERQQVR